MSAPPTYSGPAEFVQFRLDGRPCALAAAAVTEVLAAVSVRPLPHQPGYVAGVIDLRGTIVPVLDLRVRFGGTSRPGVSWTDPAFAAIIEAGIVDYILPLDSIPRRIADAVAVS